MNPQYLLNLHNHERSLHTHLRPLSLNSHLAQSAKAHADRMSKEDSLSHDKIGDGSPWERIGKHGYRYSTAGENIALGFSTEEKVFTAWKHSKNHYGNIISSWWHDVGFGLSIDHRSRWWWVANFAAPLTHPPAKHELELPKLLLSGPIVDEQLFNDYPRFVDWPDPVG